MRSAFLQILPIGGVSMFAFALSLLFATSAVLFPQATGLVPACLGLVGVGMLGSAVMTLVFRHERRLGELEERLQKFELALGDKDAEEGADRQ